MFFDMYNTFNNLFSFYFACCNIILYLCMAKKKSKGGRKKVDPKEKVVLVGFYVKNRFIEEVGGMETARAIAKASLEDSHESKPIFSDSNEFLR